MKIIHQGFIPKAKTFIATCYECGTVFEFARSEAEKVYTHKEVPYSFEIECPLCRILITTQAVPQEMNKVDEV